jgi:hypothetical protein
MRPPGYEVGFGFGYLESNLGSRWVGPNASAQPVELSKTWAGLEKARYIWAVRRSIKLDYLEPKISFIFYQKVLTENTLPSILVVTDLAQLHTKISDN